MTAAPLTFEAALKEADALFRQLNSGNTIAAQESIGTFLKNESSARGFFVMLLTSGESIADNPPAYLLEALKAAPELTATLMAKNLVMSSAAEVSHNRKQDQEAALGSAQVSRRCKILLRALSDQSFFAQLQQMCLALEQNQGSFASFAQRMNYDADQKAAALAAIDEIQS